MPGNKFLQRRQVVVIIQDQAAVQTGAVNQCGQANDHEKAERWQYRNDGELLHYWGLVGKKRTPAWPGFSLLLCRQ